MIKFRTIDEGKKKENRWIIVKGSDSFSFAFNQSINPYMTLVATNPSKIFVGFSRLHSGGGSNAIEHEM